eukprot:1207285-Karenia_brevis.AAC.1
MERNQNTYDYHLRDTDMFIISVAKPIDGAVGDKWVNPSLATTFVSTVAEGWQMATLIPAAGLARVQRDFTHKCARER